MVTHWMAFGAMEVGRSDANVAGASLPRMDQAVDWLAIRQTMDELAENAATLLEHSKTQFPNVSREIATIQYEILNPKQRLAYDGVQLYIRNGEAGGKSMMILGGPGTGKSTLIKAFSGMVTEHFNNESSVLHLGTTGTAAFVIGGATVHSALRLPVNRKYSELKGSSLCNLQTDLQHVKFIIVDEISMMGKKMWTYMDRRLRQASGKKDERFRGYFVLLIGDYNQLPPVGDKPVYTKP